MTVNLQNLDARLKRVERFALEDVGLDNLHELERRVEAIEEKFNNDHQKLNLPEPLTFSDAVALFEIKTEMKQFRHLMLGMQEAIKHLASGAVVDSIQETHGKIVITFRKK